MTTQTKTTPVPIDDFGKDHWSLLGYVGARVSSHPAGTAKGVGTLDPRHLRCNVARHPVHNVNGFAWSTHHGTRLSGFFVRPGIINEDRQLPEHDDWDCLDDLEAAGLIVIYSEVNGFVSIAPALGIEVYSQLCAHKGTGGNFADFRPKGV